MKVLQVASSLRTGGAESLATSYAVALHEYPDTEVRMLVYDGFFGPTPNWKRLTEKNIPIVYASNRQRWYYRRNNLLCRSIRKIVRERCIVSFVKDYEPDVIHFHYTPFSTIQRIQKKVPRTRCFYTIHSEPQKVFADPTNKKIAEELVHQNKIHLIALHESMKHEVDSMFHYNGTTVMNNCVDIERIQKAKKDRLHKREELGYTEEDFVVGHVGSFLPVKNHTYLLKVFKELLNENKHAKLLLVGSGRLESELRQKANEMGIGHAIQWLKDRSDIPELLGTMDVFVFPSLYEGLPLAVLEAQAAGVRVLLSDRITDQVLLSDHIKKMSIESEPKSWAWEIMKPSGQKAYSGLENYELHHVIDQMMKMYREGVTQ